ncbi:MAG: hypothetical protein ACJ746_15060 [Bryobacteraceae bacterium]
MEKTLGKVLVAFLVGVVLALGGAILYSRQPGASKPIQSTPVRAAAVGTTSPLELPKQDPIAEQTAEERREPSRPERAARPVAPAVTRGRTTATPVRTAQSQPPAELAALRNPAASEIPGNAQVSPPTAPSAPTLPPASQNSIGSLRPPSTGTSLQSGEAAPANQAAAVREPHVVTLPAGTTLAVRLGETLTSERNSNGDTFQATLDAPVVADGFIIADRKSRVIGHVVQANRAGRVKGLANLVLAVSQINTTDGQQVPVETDSYEKWGNSSVKSDTAKMAGAAALGAVIGAIAGGGKGAAIGAGAGGAAGTGLALGTRGGAASVPSESILTFRLARPITITEKFN